MIKLKDLLQEAPNKVLKIEFNNITDTRKFRSKLFSAGFRDSGNGNPPTGKEKGYFWSDDRSTIIKITSGDKLALNILKKINLPHEKEYVKPMQYVVHNHGGYLD